VSTSGKVVEASQPVALHPHITRITAQFAAHELHAARSGREVMQALADLIAESQAPTLEGLAEDLRPNVSALLAAMPAYAPPLNVLHLVYASLEQAQRLRQSVPEFRAAMAQAAARYAQWSDAARASIAARAAELIAPQATVFTFTLSETVLGALRAARQRGREFRVLVTESRPNADGRDTARLLAQAGIPVEIGIDASVGTLVPRADVMLIGAEAILSDGSAICKAGTYPAARVARRHRIPVYVLVDSRKFHALSLLGLPLSLEPLPRAAVLAGGSAAQTVVGGHLFDHTPAALIRGLVTEHGCLPPAQAAQAMLSMPLSPSLAGREGG
jgi:translation initiation factor 2B subunit (eIF-2B alpha/beta/delta family)